MADFQSAYESVHIKSYNDLRNSTQWVGLVHGIGYNFAFPWTLKHVYNLKLILKLGLQAACVSLTLLLAISHCLRSHLTQLVQPEACKKICNLTFCAEPQRSL